MTQQAISAIVIKAIAFEEQTHILTLFSKERGKIALAIKQPKRAKRQGFSPLLAVEAIVVPSEKDVWKCFSCEVTNSFPRLRMNLEVLRYAVGTTHILAQALPMHAPSDALYDEYISFLSLIPAFTHPHVAATAFMAKLCLHEGILGAHGPLAKDDAELCLQLAEKPFGEIHEYTCDKALLRKLAVVVTR